MRHDELTIRLNEPKRQIKIALESWNWTMSQFGTSEFSSSFVPMGDKHGNALLLRRWIMVVCCQTTGGRHSADAI